jgi:hypothetical protein
MRTVLHRQDMIALRVVLDPWLVPQQLRPAVVPAPLIIPQKSVQLSSNSRLSSAWLNDLLRWVSRLLPKPGRHLSSAQSVRRGIVKQSFVKRKRKMLAAKRSVKEGSTMSPPHLQPLSRAVARSLRLLPQPHARTRATLRSTTSNRAMLRRRELKTTLPKRRYASNKKHRWRKRSAWSTYNQPVAMSPY